jgi:hypothetical protein
LVPRGTPAAAKPPKFDDRYEAALTELPQKKWVGKPIKQVLGRVDARPDGQF